MSFTLEPLYENNKIWQICWFNNNDGTYSIKTQHGQINGKLVEHVILVTEGKNIGKKNETTIEKQAELESKREWTKKIKQGYHTINTESHSAILKPMLAQEYKNNAKFPVWIQPKLDGVRCLIYLNNDEIVFQSRQNTIYEPFIHLVPELSTILNKMPPNTILDGELYTHGLGFETIVSMVRRAKTRHPDLLKLKYTLYDFFIKGNNTLLYEERLKTLKALFVPNKYIELIETRIANDLNTLNNMLDFYIDQNYEGIMIRNNGVYKEGNRSKDLLKYKKFMDGEFEVIGHHMSKVDTPVFDCKCADNKTFSVMMKEDVETKSNRMNNISQYYGKKLTVKFQELTSDGIPRFPVGICFRDYE
jgi:DNA ligase-1